VPHELLHAPAAWRRAPDALSTTASGMARDRRARPASEGADGQSAPCLSRWASRPACTTRAAASRPIAVATTRPITGAKSHAQASHPQILLVITTRLDIGLLR